MMYTLSCFIDKKTNTIYSEYDVERGMVINLDNCIKDQIIFSNDEKINRGDIFYQLFRTAWSLRCEKCICNEIKGELIWYGKNDDPLQYNVEKTCCFKPIDTLPIQFIPDIIRNEVPESYLRYKKLQQLV